MPLEEYRKKRDFGSTQEPQGDDEGESKGGLRFAVQHHMARREHYDLRLEWKGVMLSWAVPKGPSFNPKEKRLAIQVEDHPLEYRDFEGTIPKGEYGGGTVMIWDEGFWEPEGDADDALREGALKFSLFGKRLKGNWALIRLEQKKGEDKVSWLLLKEKDEHALDEDGIDRYVESVRTGRTMEEIERGEGAQFAENPFDEAEPQLPKLVKKPPDGDEWLYEVKYDGYRIIAFVERGAARLITRKAQDFTRRFPKIAASLSSMAGPRAMVIDGEVVAADSQGRTDFVALQSYMRDSKGKKLAYMAFDLLALDGEDLRELPLSERKEMLKALLEGAPGNIHFSEHVVGGGKEAFSAACEMCLEGIVGKRAGSAYRGGRSGDWIKVKCDSRQEFVIGGYTVSENRLDGISSLMLGYFEGKKLIFAGRAGSGLSEREMRELLKKFEDLERESCPFDGLPQKKKGEKVVWLQPKFVAEVRFAGWTREGLLRQPSYKGLRLDKEAREVVLEEAVLDEPEDDEGEVNKMEKGEMVLGIKISNPDKVIFRKPLVKKIDIARYYEAVAERMLPYVEKRILSIIRCPKGISSPCFFKKHPTTSRGKGVKPIAVKNSEGKDEEYFYIESAEGLVGEAQMGTVEFHVWGSRAEDVERPDMMVFDLDPDEGMELEKVRQGVRDLKAILDRLSLESFLKTSGGKGYHVVVPFEPSADWESFYALAKQIALVMESGWPDLYTTNSRKEKRKGKIFIDWVRNGRGSTSVAPYSLRARDGAKVSMPIAWEELDLVAPDGIGMGEALERAKGEDPWEGFFKVSQKIGSVKIVPPKGRKR
jgi:bifunctional non-homologous end joining protein LigD